MSKRQPTLKVGGLTIAHDEIVKIINQHFDASSDGRKRTPVPKAVQLVDGTIIPLESRRKVKEIIEFIDRYDQ